MSTAPAEVIDNAPVIFQYNGKEYKLPPLKLKQWSEFCEWVAFFPYNRAKNQGIAKEELRDILKECNGKFYSVQSFEVLQMIVSFPGSLKIMEISLKFGQPSISEQEIDDVLTNSDWLEIWDRVLSKNGFAPKTETTEGNENPPSQV